MKVEISKRFTGKNELFYDSTSGEYRESLPRIQGDAALIQLIIVTQVKPRSVLERLVGMGK